MNLLNTITITMCYTNNVLQTKYETVWIIYMNNETK